ncbi:phosphotransferase family protein [Sphingomonas sp. ASV193]|uniref:phosphotransferase family protein n=1 Tax=Sphingomonas sp. ASV193 TaxID=3144405 RepID=UPI0032E9373F
MDRTEANSGTREVADRLRFDEAALAAWMAGHVEGFEGPLAVRQFKGGQSNPTYRLDTPARSYVLRRKPPGATLPGAHAVDREARVMAALGPTGFPVPRVFATCDDEGVIGTPFFVMDMVEGRIVWEATFPGLAPADRAAHFDAMNRTIARLHAIDPAAVGLADYGAPAAFVERQVRRWSKQYLGDVEGGRVPAMDALVDWLGTHLPPDSGEARIVHGDFRCDNMIFAADAPEVKAVLDWELSTIGDPAADFVYHLMMYRMPAGMFTGLKGLDFAALGIPTEEDYVAAYCRRTGRERIANLDYLSVFVMFRLAAITHGIRGRLRRGSASSAHAEATAAYTEPLAELALAQARAARLD